MIRVTSLIVAGGNIREETTYIEKLFAEQVKKGKMAPEGTVDYFGEKFAKDDPLLKMALVEPTGSERIVAYLHVNSFPKVVNLFIHLGCAEDKIPRFREFLSRNVE